MQLNIADKRIGKMAAALVIVLAVVGGWFLINRNKTKKLEEKINPEIILESSKMIDGSMLKNPMTEAEKQAIEEVFKQEGAEMTILRDVSNGQAIGTAWRHFDGKKFSFKLEANRLADVDKGFYYEGWLVGENGFFSVGRMAVLAGQGKLYYSAAEDKSGFKGVVLTLEPEDGQITPDKHILEGNF